MAGISMNCKNGAVAAFGDCVGSASRALCGLTEAAGQVEDAQTNKSFWVLMLFDDGREFFCFLISSQAAYLVGVSDPNSQAGHQGLVDPVQFAKANQAIQMACQNLVDPESSPSQVPSLSTISYQSTPRRSTRC